MKSIYLVLEKYTYSSVLGVVLHTKKIKPLNSRGENCEDAAMLLSLKQRLWHQILTALVSLSVLNGLFNILLIPDSVLQPSRQLSCLAVFPSSQSHRPMPTVMETIALKGQATLSFLWLKVSD